MQSLTVPDTKQILEIYHNGIIKSVAANLQFAEGLNGPYIRYRLSVKTLINFEDSDPVIKSWKLAVGLKSDPNSALTQFTHKNRGVRWPIVDFGAIAALTTSSLVAGCSCPSWFLDNAFKAVNLSNMTSRAKKRYRSFIRGIWRDATDKGLVLYTGPYGRQNARMDIDTSKAPEKLSDNFSPILKGFEDSLREKNKEFLSESKVDEGTRRVKRKSDGDGDKDMGELSSSLRLPEPSSESTSSSIPPPTSKEDAKDDGLRRSSRTLVTIQKKTSRKGK